MGYVVSFTARLQESPRNLQTYSPQNHGPRHRKNLSRLRALSAECSVQEPHTSRPPHTSRTSCAHDQISKAQVMASPRGNLRSVTNSCSRSARPSFNVNTTLTWWEQPGQAAGLAAVGLVPEPHNPRCAQG